VTQPRDFVEGASAEARTKALQQLRLAGWDAQTTFALFTAQVLMNVNRRDDQEECTHARAEPAQTEPAITDMISNARAMRCRKRL
jgi:hypothetical protein